jgi:hypothetical protein
MDWAWLRTNVFQFCEEVLRWPRRSGSGGQSAKMISSSLLDTEVVFDQGEATVEVTEIHKESNPGSWKMIELQILWKTRLYDFDADRHLVRVLDGEAVVEDGGPRIKVKGGREVNLTNDEPLRAMKFDKQMTEEGDLYQWTS